MTQGLAVDGELAALDGRAVMMYDGLCGFCNSAVRWVIRQDHADRFRFIAQQSPLAAGLLAQSGIDQAAMLQGNSVYLMLDAGTARQRLLTQSDATVNMLLRLGGRWRALGLLLRAVPAFLRNWAYRVFARNRYRISEQYTACPLPNAAEQLKFLA